MIARSHRDAEPLESAHRGAAVAAEEHVRHLGQRKALVDLALDLVG